MSELRKAEVSVGGPINGMGEPDIRGEYYKLFVMTEDDEIVRVKLSRGQVEDLRAQCASVLVPNHPTIKTAKVA